MVKGAVNVVFGTSVVGDGSSDATVVIMLAVAALTFRAVTLLVAIELIKMSVVIVLSGAVLVLDVASLVFAISGVVRSVLSAALPILGATVVDSSIMILLAGIIFELGKTVFILVVPTVTVVSFVLDSAVLVFGTVALVFVIFSKLKVVPESVLLVLKGAELNILLEFIAVVAILLDIVALATVAVLLKHLGAELVLPIMVVEPFPEFSVFVISCVMLVLNVTEFVLLLVGAATVLSGVLLTFTADSLLEAPLTSVEVVLAATVIVLGTTAFVLNGFVVVELAGFMLVLGAVELIIVSMPTAVVGLEFERAVLVFEASACVIVVALNP